MSYKTQEMLRVAGIVLALILLIALAIGLVSAIVAKRQTGDYDKIKVKWTVGGLDENGAFLKKETDSLVSDHIALDQGLKVIVDFDKSVKYNVMFYDENNIFLGEMDGGATTSNKVFSRTEIEAMYPDVEYFRITLIDIEDKDGFIGFFEKGKLGNYVTVYTCNKAEEPVTEPATN